MAGFMSETQSRRWMGSVLVLSAFAQLALLAAHPMVTSHDFSDVLRAEAADRVRDALVHGAFTVVVAVQLVGYAALSLHLDPARAVTMAGFVFFALGAALLVASVIVDGLVIPGLAARYVDTSREVQSGVRPVFIFAGLLIAALMPLGLAFQGAGILFWGTRLSGSAKASGMAACLLGAATLAAGIAAVVFPNPALIMAAIAGTTLWAVLAGAILMRRPPPRDSQIQS